MAIGERDLIRRLAVELEAMNARHGCGQIECSIAMETVAEARRVLGLRRNEPFPIGAHIGPSSDPTDEQPYGQL